MARSIYVERIADGTVVGVFCSRDCFETRKGDTVGCLRVPLPPFRSRTVAAYAVSLLACDECGINLADMLSD